MAISAGLITTLINAGPLVLRWLAQSIGGKKGDAAERVADLIEQCQKSPVDVKHETLDRAIKQMTLDQQIALQELEIEIQKLDNQRIKDAQVHEQTFFVEAQKTARVEQKHGDTYVKHTRPKMARWAGIAGTTYVFLFELLAAISRIIAQLIPSATEVVLSGARWDIALMLYTPLLSYMGVRTIDRFSKKGHTQ